MIIEIELKLICIKTANLFLRIKNENIICVCLMQRYYISHRRKLFHGNSTLLRPLMHLCSPPFKVNEQWAHPCLPNLISLIHISFCLYNLLKLEGMTASNSKPEANKKTFCYAVINNALICNSFEKFYT